MATTSIPEPTSLKSWDEAFQYPLPTVRKLSLRLRKDIDEHRSRLRSLVGTSYRDLLGTAERIIEMDKQIQSVDSKLSDIGRRCNSNLLDRSDTNYTRLERAWTQEAGEEQKLRSTAQCKILGAALSAVGRLIRAGESPLQAAKLMVLTRLLYKSLADAKVPPVLERYRRMIAVLRTRLLSYIDQQLIREQSSTDELVGALTAYALLTSSAPKAVLKHLLVVRTKQLEAFAGRPTTDSTLAALSLYTATFASVQAVFPKRLAESLSALSRTALLSDKQIKSVEALNLDIYGRWIADDIRAFTPWVQQESLSAQDGRQAMSEYSAEARAILQGLKQCLASISAAEVVLEVRSKVMGASINVGTRIKSSSFEEQFEELREVFMERLEELAKKTTVLNDFSPVYEVSARTRPSIWSLAQDDIDLSSGGMSFRKAVLRQRSGRDASIDRVLAPFDTWRSRLEAFWSNVEAMRAAKWDEYLDIDLDDGDDEDAVPYQDVLSKQDAARLQKRLHIDVRDAIKDGLQRVEVAMQKNTGQPQFYLRLIRELHDQQLQLAQAIGLQDVQELARHDLSRELHSQLAKTIADHGIETLRSAYTRRHFVPVDLWEGSPKLPLQPLPATFKFVMSIQQEMATIGEDVWSTAAVLVLKDAVQLLLRDLLSTAIIVPTTSDASTAIEPSGERGKDNAVADETSDEAAKAMPNNEQASEVVTGTDSTQGATSGEATDETSVTKLADENPVSLDLDNTQRLFDGYYLAKVFCTSKSSELDAALKALKERTALDANDVQRLERYASDYWKKTFLLFGLLAESSKSYSR
ncbi:hypothetical protein AMS68_007557 [Peltaster fructicola]|uniref:Conserved oligomeric Golgi complex subunit 1 n=1 Tax=Peltaster fructicola TaxID=286661 RepID=A0A6H0Y617_9PEZI|nr:hypothetical protein AMS68_007557 [Peltaster fructicola]